MKHGPLFECKQGTFENDEDNVLFHIGRLVGVSQHILGYTTHRKDCASDVCDGCTCGLRSARSELLIAINIVASSVLKGE